MCLGHFIMSGILILELLLQFADVTRFLGSQTRADLASKSPNLLKHPQLAGKAAPRAALRIQRP